MADTVQTTTNISSLPTYAQPYYKNMMDWAQAQTTKPYQPYGGERIAGYTDAQKQVQANVLGMGAPNQFALGSGLSAAAGLGALGAANYTPSAFSAQQVGMPNLQQYRMTMPNTVQAQNYTAPQMQAAQTQFQPNLNYFQMENAPQVGAAAFGPVRDVTAQRVNAPMMNAAQTQWQANLERFQMAAPDKFTGLTAQEYMSPYAQNVMDVQKREAVRDAQKQQLVQDLGAARQGTYGGSRQLLAGLERERNLGQQLGDIQARGQQSAYESAQSQFERDRAAQMAAQQANLQAALGVQELGTTTGLQATLANLSNEQQSRVNNQALAFQAQGMNADSALRAALANQGVDVTRAQANQQARMQAQMANQQAALTAGQQNLQARLGVQQLGTQTGLQAALANLDAASQANVQNLAAKLQTQGLNADQALRAALANQQAELTVGQQNLGSALQTQQLGVDSGLRALLANQQADLEAQRLREQSNQFGAQNALEAFGLANQTGQTLGNLGQIQQQSDLARLQAQMNAAGMNQALEQQYLDQDYQDFLNQRDYEQNRYILMSQMLNGLPISPNTMTTTTAPSPSALSQIGGLGLGAAGIYNMFRGG